MKKLFIVLTLCLLVSNVSYAQEANQNHVLDGHILKFDGVDDVVIVGPFKDMTVNTFEAWVKPSGRKRGAVIANGGGPKAYCGSGVSLWARIHEVCYVIDPDGCGNYHRICATGDFDNQWVHIAGTYDGELIRIYVNGELANYNGEVKMAPSKWLTFGGFQFYNGIQKHFDGEMKDVRIWDYARSLGEIQETMQKRLTGKEKGLVGYWKKIPQLKWFTLALKMCLFTCGSELK